jgi:BirA family biotin operon repressor/biotin-[acetyl-CoA-carboxylase] ligase
LDKYNILKFCELDSTNNYALSLKSSLLFREGLVITSDFQSSGQGQRGSVWESEKKKNLLFSIVIEPNISISHQFDLNVISSLALIDYLQSLGINSKIKWPNDILVDSRKIAGILIKNIVFKNKITHSIIGIGLNVNQINFGDYRPKATSCFLELHRSCLINEALTNLLNFFHHRIDSYRANQFLIDEYLNNLFRKDKVSFFENNSERFSGTIRGVNRNGLLEIEIQRRIRNFNLKEIKFLF